MRQIWFTSDQHFDHANVIKYCNRPFANKEEMNETIINNYNNLVAPGDIVFHLGDFAMGHKPVELYLPRLNGEKHLIVGNHDHVHPSHAKYKKDPERWTKYYLDHGFKTIDTSGELEIGDYKFKMSHFPYKNLESGEHGLKHAEYRPNYEHTILLHGHVHQVWKTKVNMVNVGVDVWDFKPVHLSEIITLILNPDHSK